MNGLFCSICIILLVGLGFSCHAQKCSEKKPIGNFTDDDFAGAYYLIAQKIGYDSMVPSSNCGWTYSAVQDCTWTFTDLYQNNDSKTDMEVSVGHMDPPGRWNITSVDGKQFFYVVTVVGAVPKSWALLYSCNQDTGDSAVWVFYKDRVQGMSGIPRRTRRQIQDAMRANNIRATDTVDVKNQQCSCI